MSNEDNTSFEIKTENSTENKAKNETQNWKVTSELV